MKTRLLASLLVIASLALVAGCGPAPAPAAPTQAPVAAATKAPESPPAGEPVKITIFVGFGTGTEPEQIELHNQLAEEFNSTHDDIQIEFVTVAYEEHDTKFMTMLSGGMAPDLVMPIGVMGIAAYYDEWLDIAPYIERDSYDTSDFYGPTVELQTYADKTVGLPIGVYPSVTFYNEDLFDEAGLEYPPHEFGTADWSYDKLAEISQQLTLDGNGNDATSADFDPDNIMQWGWDGLDWVPFKAVPAKFGGTPTGMSADYKTAEMTSPAWMEAMQFIQDSVWKTYYRPNGEVASSLFTDDPMASGQVAMWECFSWMAYNYGTWTEAFNWDVAAIPAGPHGDLTAEANADVFAIPKSSKHPDQAWEVGKWLMQPEVMSRLAGSYGCIPARKSLAESWKEGMAAEYPDVDWQVFIDSIEYMDSDPNHEGWYPSYTKIWDATENAMTLIVTEKDQNVQDVMQALNSEVQDYLDEYWATQ